MAALETTENKIIHQGDSSSVAFDVPFLFYADTDLNVYLNDTTSEDPPVLVDVADYTVAGAGDDDGGTVTMDTAPLSTEELIIEREVDEDQESAYTNYNRFPGPTLTKNFNRVVMMVQQHSEQLSRSLLKPINETTPTTIPSPSTGKALKWDSEGNLVNSTYDPDDQQQSIADAQAAQVAAEAAEAGAVIAEAGAVAAVQNINASRVKYSCISSTEVIIESGSTFTGLDSGAFFTFAENRTFDITGTPGDLGALDTGESEAIDTHYYLIALGDTTGAVNPHIIGVSATSYASFTTANLIDNYAAYDDYKRIGNIRNNGSSNFIQGAYLNGRFYVDDSEANKIQTTSATYVDAVFSHVAPLTARMAEIVFTNDTSGDVRIRRKGAVNGSRIPTGEVSAIHEFSLTMPLSAAQVVEWNITAGILFGQLVSYEDDLSEEGQ